MKNLTTYAALAALAVVGYFGWRAYRKGTGLADEVRQFADQVKADAQSAYVNNVSGPYERGRVWAETGKDPQIVSTKAALYSDYGYTGIDGITGTPVIDGEWYGDAVARRYEAEQRARGAAPAASTVNGAAFGVYPRAF